MSEQIVMTKDELTAFAFLIEEAMSHHRTAHGTTPKTPIMSKRCMAAMSHLGWVEELIKRPDVKVVVGDTMPETDLVTID